MAIKYYMMGPKPTIIPVPRLSTSDRRSSWWPDRGNPSWPETDHRVRGGVEIIYCYQIILLITEAPPLLPGF